MTADDAYGLIDLCDKALADLQRFDAGTPYESLQLSEQFSTIAEPLLNGDQLSSDLKRTVPLAHWRQIKVDLVALSRVQSHRQGQAVNRHAGQLIRIKQALTSFAHKSLEHAATDVLAVEGRDSDPLTFQALLHPEIVAHALPQFQNGHLRDAVLNGVIAVFDLIRRRTDLMLDGKALLGRAFGLEKGALVFSELESDSGKNEQIGFMQMFEGIYTGVRNVKAHSLSHDLDPVTTAQYLVTLSLLARRVDECKLRE